MSKKLTYADAGVDYQPLDAFKLLAQQKAVDTARNVYWYLYKEAPSSRGESVYLVEMGDHYLAHTIEGLGTKNLIADAVSHSSGCSDYYRWMAWDTVAAIINDLITLGARPLTTAMHLAVAESTWFDDPIKISSLVDGWQKACHYVECTWGGGETAILEGIIQPNAAQLSGAAIGLIKPKSKRIMGNIQDGDAIVFLESSGLHANGLTMARKVADRLPAGYETPVPDTDCQFGALLLVPSKIYSPTLMNCLATGIKVHYCVNITGHGWRKLMRLPQPFSYVIEQLPQPQPIFRFIQELSHLDDKEMYATFNMGVGYALFVSERDSQLVIETTKYSGVTAFRAGHVEKSDRKQIIIQPKNIVFTDQDLQIR